MTSTPPASEHQGAEPSDLRSVYVQGVERAVAVLAGIQAEHADQSFTMYVKATGDSALSAFDDSYFTVATTAEEFAARKQFTEAVAEVAMTSGAIAVGVVGEREEGRGFTEARVWLVGYESGIVPVPATAKTTAQMGVDFPDLAGAEHHGAGVRKFFPEPLKLTAFRLLLLNPSFSVAGSTTCTPLRSVQMLCTSSA